MDNNERQRKHQALKKKLKLAEERGVEIHTDLMVINYHDGGPVGFKRWDGQDWVEIVLDISPRA